MATTYGVDVAQGISPGEGGVLYTVPTSTVSAQVYRLFVEVVDGTTKSGLYAFYVNNPLKTPLGIPVFLTKITNIIPGNDIRFSVASLNVTGTQIGYNYHNATYYWPEPPIITSVSGGVLTATVIFSPPANLLDVTGYLVKTNKNDPSTSLENLTVISENEPYVYTIAINPADVGVYYFTLWSALFDNGTTRRVSSAAISNPVTLYTVPNVPTNIVATALPGAARISFTIPNDNFSPITKYTIQSSPGSITSTGTTSPIIVSTLTPGISYSFTVTATNSAGDGPTSAASNAVTPTDVLGKGGSGLIIVKYPIYSE